MSEDEQRRMGMNEEEQDEVEAHRKHTFDANSEDTEGEDDFEAHRSHRLDHPKLD